MVAATDAGDGPGIEIDPSRTAAAVFSLGVLTGVGVATRQRLHPGRGDHRRARGRPAPGGPGLTAVPEAVDLVRSLRAAGVRTAVVSDRADQPAILAAAGIEELFEVQVDSVEARRLGLRLPPAPDLVSEALARLVVSPGRAAVVARSPRGVAAGRAAGAGILIGVQRAGREDGLASAGADVTVGGLARIGLGAPSSCCEAETDGPNRWVLFLEGVDPADEARREALCATGNGYLATRGAAPESSADGVHYPGTYLAGVYNRLSTTIEGGAVEHEDLVNAPNWLPLTFRADGGEWFGGRGWTVLEQHQAFDTRHAILGRRLRVSDPAGRITEVTQRRLASMDQPHLSAMVTTLVPENWSGAAEVRSGIDGTVANGGVASYQLLAHRHLAVHHTDVLDDEAVGLVAETVQSRIRIAVATRCQVTDGEVTARRVEQRTGRVDQHLSVVARKGEPITVEKVAGIATSRDIAISECSRAAARVAREAGSFVDIAAAHRAAWERLWARSNLWVDTGGRTPAIVHLHLLHLLQSVSPHTAELDAGVTARGLHGEAYRGHVFWDEVFVLPLLNYRFPELSRALLRYRYRRLGTARALARQAGYEGAMFPWQSGTSGREETPTRFFNPRSGRWMADHSRLQRHVSLAVAANVWRYYQVTGDLDFMVRFGAELLVEIARFWASAAEYDPGRDRYDVRGMMGPDEFHDGPPDRPGAGLVNNAYTNVMAAWALWRAGQAVDLVAGRGGGRLFERLDLRPRELAAWEHVGTHLAVPFDRGGRIAQFEGYDNLEELDWDAYRSRYGDIGRLDLILEAEGDTPNRYQVAKQADVLMLFFMLTADELTDVLHRLGYRFDPASIPDHVRHYLARTSNGSTLSEVVHAWVLARSDRGAAWQLLLDALAADIDDTQGGTTGEGIHLGAMAGSVDLLQRCFVDLDARDDTLHVNPRLPDELPRLRFNLDYRGHRLELDVTHTEVAVRSRPGSAPPVRIAVRDHAFDLGGDATHTVALRRA